MIDLNQINWWYVTAVESVIAAVLVYIFFKRTEKKHG